MVRGFVSFFSPSMHTLNVSPWSLVAGSYIGGQLGRFLGVCKVFPESVNTGSIACKCCLNCVLTGGRCISRGYYPIAVYLFDSCAWGGI